jgi:hypothetical protein
MRQLTKVYGGSSYATLSFLVEFEHRQRGQRAKERISEYESTPCPSWSEVLDRSVQNLRKTAVRRQKA